MNCVVMFRNRIFQLCKIVKAIFPKIRSSLWSDYLKCLCLLINSDLEILMFFGKLKDSHVFFWIQQQFWHLELGLHIFSQKQQLSSPSVTVPSDLSSPCLKERLVQYAFLLEGSCFYTYAMSLSWDWYLLLATTSFFRWSYWLQLHTAFFSNLTLHS